MEASALDALPLKGFKDFYQYASTTRVIAGRGLLESTGFELQKEGARRVFVDDPPFFWWMLKERFGRN